MKAAGIRCVVSVALAFAMMLSAESQEAPPPAAATPAPGREAPLRVPLPSAPFPSINPRTSAHWPLPNLDIWSRRYSTLDQMKTSNIRSLAVKWLHHTRNASASPIVVDGVMYLTSTTAVTALNAETGKVIWTNPEAASNRGAAYGAGRIYLAEDDAVIALDARTGQFVEEFGERGRSRAAVDLLTNRFPQMPRTIADWGYYYNMAPQYFDGIVIVGTATSERLIPSGAVLALDGRTGRLIWSFFTVPHGPQDQGWDLAKDTWRGGVRAGGGIWATPAVDAETGTLFVTTGNPAPSQDGSARRGVNLFTNSIVALNVRTGALKWHFQHVHHDLWDYDSGQQPSLFDVVVRGTRIKAVASANKNGYVYIFNRETGQPINPIVETPFPTATSTPGEEVWPTQPIPHSASGRPMVPAAAQAVDKVFPQFEHVPIVPFYTPPSIKGAVHAPREGVHYGSNSFNPQTGFLYVAGKDLPIFLTVTPVANTLEPGTWSNAGRRDSAYYERGNVSAYDPATGELAWRAPVAGGPSAGTLTTAGNLVFAGDRQGTFYAFNAKTGERLWAFDTGGGIIGSQLTYQINGTQYIAVPSGGDSIIAFALLGK